VNLLNRISFQDVDSPGTVRVTLAMDDNQDDLNATSGAGVVVNGSGNSTITLDGTIAAINAFLASGAVRWNPTGSTNGETGTLTISIDDNGTAAGGNTTSVTVTVAEFNPDITGAINNNFNAVNIVGESDFTPPSGSGSADTITTSWSNTTGTQVTYDGGGDTDTITLVFSASQLEAILANSTDRAALQTFADGTINGSLNLGSTAWNAIVNNYENATLAIAAGGSGKVDYSAINTGGTDADLPDYLAGVTGTNAGNTLVGTSGGETITGGATASDTATSGTDILIGGDGDDILWGGDAADLLLGGNDADKLHGGTGNDILSGGLGADDFLFEQSGSGNNDQITDYSFVQGDRIDLSELLDGAFGGPSSPIPANEIANYVQVTQSGNDVTVSVDTNGLTGGTNWSSVVTLVGYGTSSANDPINIIFDGLDHTFKI
jgi:Ca2+-binding RTX toxin-like protein